MRRSTCYLLLPWTVVNVLGKPFGPHSNFLRCIDGAFCWRDFCLGRFAGGGGGGYLLQSREGVGEIKFLKSRASLPQLHQTPRHVNTPHLHCISSTLARRLFDPSIHDVNNEEAGAGCASTTQKDMLSHPCSTFRGSAAGRGV